MLRAWYNAPIAEFAREEVAAIVGALAASSEFDLTPEQRRAWQEEIAILRREIAGMQGTLLLEFLIPRVGRRADAVLILGPAVFVLEFKVGEAKFTPAAREQVWDYALDLKNFHEASHHAPIVPMLIPTAAADRELAPAAADDDGVYRPWDVPRQRLRQAIEHILAATEGARIAPEVWRSAPYRPTPTIVEAARALYAQHTVEAIARSDAEARNLAVTAERVRTLAAQAQSAGRKAICMVTGVPGAGKTLVGLDLATQRARADDRIAAAWKGPQQSGPPLPAVEAGMQPRPRGPQRACPLARAPTGAASEVAAAPPHHAVYLSGNRPLVSVLREALVRDEIARRGSRAAKLEKLRVRQRVEAFIQNVHNFRDEGLISPAPPDEHLVIFDEAQRAWNLRKTADFMRRRKQNATFAMSEPEFLIACMDRHRDWAVIVCLVGGGQEINAGEAGIAEWLRALAHRFPHWQLHLSPRLTGNEYAAEPELAEIQRRGNIVFDEALHLAVSMRSFRAERVSEFVRALLDCELERGRSELRGLDRYPMIVTRDLAAAKRWLRQRARGSDRYGLLASSRAQRLKPHAIDVRVDVNPVHWFLNGREDTRSSYYLEDAATEFDVQGLELDWACVTWDGDLRFAGDGWSHHKFLGARWTQIHDPANRAFLRNAYRVLLTRARQGMAIFVPPGDPSDPTRNPAFYDSTFRYLADLGLPVLP